jgi:hypothetical protein
MDQGPEMRQKVLHFRTVIDYIPAGTVTMGSFFHPEFCHNPKQPFIQPVRKSLMGKYFITFHTTVYLAHFVMWFSFFCATVCRSCNNQVNSCSHFPVVDFNMNKVYVIK